MGEGVREGGWWVGGCCGAEAEAREKGRERKERRGGRVGGTRRARVVVRSAVCVRVRVGAPACGRSDRIRRGLDATEDGQPARGEDRESEGRTGRAGRRRRPGRWRIPVRRGGLRPWFITCGSG